MAQNFDLGPRFSAEQEAVDGHRYNRDAEALRYYNSHCTFFAGGNIALLRWLHYNST
jgi:hypothetical protein